MNRIIEHLKENWIKYGFETLVITAGILLAFGLNSWNEGRKTKQLEVDMIRSLIKSTEANLWNEVETGKRELVVSKSAEIMQVVLDNDLPYHDSLEIHFRGIYLHYETWIDYSAFEMLKNSNYILISSDSLREQVRNWYGVRLPGRESIQDEIKDIIKDMVNHNEWFKGYNPIELTDFEKLKKDHRFHGLVSYKIWKSKAWGQRLTDSARNSYPLLVSLREELAHLEGQ